MEEMPETSEQMQGLTTSQDGVGRVAKLQPVSHFYIDGGNQAGDFTQVANQSFGAVNDDQFRTTATVSFSGNKDIYALCMGTVFLQPQTGDATKINLVLKPFKQPINGLNIKYIVYRGLEKSDFVATDGKVAGSETSGSGFVKYIWAQYNKFYGDTTPEFMASFLGFPHTSEELQLQEATHLMGQYFFKIASIDETTSEEDPATAYDLPIIPRGMHLGKATGSIGVDIVLNDGDYIIENDTLPFQLDLAYARAPFYVIDTANQADAFMKKRLKEVATKFIDIAAFYGLHANGTGKLYVDEIETPLTTKEEIASRLQNFNTKNNFYLYIQANRQRSYNFYNNYTHSEGNDNTIKIGATEDNLSETIFGTQGWPIHIISQAQDPATENNTVTFQLTTDTYDGAALFVQIGELTSAHEENFVRNTNLLQELSTDPTVEVDTNYTKALQLMTPSIGADTIAGFSQCIYEGKQIIIEKKLTEEENGEVINYSLKDKDDLFGLINAKSVFSKSHESQQSSVIYDRLQIVNFPNTTNANDVSVIKCKKIEDKLQTIDENSFLNRVSYESLIHNVKRNITPHLKKTSDISDINKSETKIYGDKYNNFYKPNLPYTIKTETFTDNQETINGVIIETTDNSNPTKIILGLSQEENNRLIDLIEINELIQPKIFFRKDDYLNQSEDDYSISPELIKYNKYVIGITGEKTSGIDGLKLFFPLERIEVYSIDGYIYISKKYSEYIVEEFLGNLVTLNLSL